MIRGDMDRGHADSKWGGEMRRNMEKGVGEGT